MFSLLFVMLINPIQTNADVFGGKWTSSPTYYLSTSNAYYSNISAGASRWNTQLSAISANINIQYVGAISASISVNTFSYGSTGWNAMGSTDPVLTSGTYTYGNIKINTSYMDSYSITKKSAICTHEWGHVLGIAHTMSASINSLMYYGGSSVYFDDWGISSPTQYDKTQLNLIY